MKGISVRNGKVCIGIVCAMLVCALCLFCVFSTVTRARAQEKASPFGVSPLMIGEYDGENDYDEYDNLIVYVCDEDGTLCVQAEGRASGALAEYDFSSTVVVYYPTSDSAATLLVSYLDADRTANAMLASDVPARMATMRKTLTGFRGVLDMRQATDADWKSVRDTVNKNCANVAWVSTAYSAQDIWSLRKLSVMVWIDSAGGKADSIATLAKGTDGIVTSSPAVFSAVLSSYQNVISPRPMVVCHRGNTGLVRDDGTLCPENSLEGAAMAFENGADGVEIDVYLTKDGVPVIMHNDTIDATTTGKGSIMDMTLAQLRQYKLKTDSQKYTYEIPVLEDYCKRFAGTDAMFFVELKHHQTDLVEKVTQMLEKYDMQYNVVFISFTLEHLQAVRECMPEASLSYLTMEAMTPSKARTMCGPLNAGSAPPFNMISDDSARAMLRLGIGSYVWTFGDNITFKNAYIHSPYRSLTCDLLGDQVKDFTVNEFTLSTDRDKPTKVCGTVRYYDGGKEENVKLELIKLSGDLNVTASGDGYYASGEGEAVVAPVYTETGLKGFTMVGAPIKVSTKAADGAGKSGGGCGGQAAASVSAAGVCLLIACLAIVHKRRATKRGE